MIFNAKIVDVPVCVINGKNEQNALTVNLTT